MTFLQDVLKSYKDIEKKFRKEMDIEGIKLTINQISLIIKGPPSIPIKDIYVADELMKAELVSFFEDKVILSTFDPEERELYDDKSDPSVLILRSLINKVKEHICACTGIETIVKENEVIIYVDLPELTADQVSNVDKIMETKGRIMLSDRPYILYADMGD